MKRTSSKSRKPTSGRVGFCVQLPRRTIKEIRLRVTRTKPQWRVVADAFESGASYKEARDEK